MWAGLIANARYRRAGRSRPVLATTGIVSGIATIAAMSYAFIAIALAPTGAALPAPAHWVSAAVDNEAGAEQASAQETAPNPGTSVPAPTASSSLDPLEAERLALGQSVGTASFVLRQTASPDGTWPASLAVTTDGTTLMSPDGVILAPIPPGAQVLYSTSSDRREYSLTLIGPSGVTATLVSTTGIVETSMP